MILSPLTGLLKKPINPANALDNAAESAMAKPAANAVENCSIQSAEGAADSFQYQQLKNDLRHQEAASAFDPAGYLNPEALHGADLIIKSGDLKNPNIPDGYSKWSTDTYQSPAGDFQVHYYGNDMGDIYYGLDYKVKFNNGLGKK